jgi:hypothetical protein
VLNANERNVRRLPATWFVSSIGVLCVSLNVFAASPSPSSYWARGWSSDVVQGSYARPWLFEQKFTADNGGPNTYFGTSEAIEGDIAVIGADSATVGVNTYQGAAYVFQRQGNSWVQLQELTASDGAAGDQFGYRVAIAGDTIVVGAFTATVNSNYNSGAAYVFTRSGDTWTENQKLAAADGGYFDDFGSAVTLDPTGTTAYIGAQGATLGANYAQGAVYVFQQSGGTWSQIQKLTIADGEAADDFGNRIALDGSTMLIGANDATVNGDPSVGEAFVFTYTGGSWVQTQKLTSNDAQAYDYFGISVVLQGDTALIGANNATVNGNGYQGAVYVFTRADGLWTQSDKLVATDGGQGDYFGVTMSLDGDTVLIGADGATVGGNADQGAVYVFQNQNGSWLQQQKLTVDDGAVEDYFGASLVLSGDTGLVGTPHPTIDGNGFQGAAYFFLKDRIFGDGFESSAP